MIHMITHPPTYITSPTHLNAQVSALFADGWHFPLPMMLSNQLLAFSLNFIGFTVKRGCGGGFLRRGEGGNAGVQVRIRVSLLQVSSHIFKGGGAFYLSFTTVASSAPKYDTTLTFMIILFQVSRLFFVIFFLLLHSEYGRLFVYSEYYMVGDCPDVGGGLRTVRDLQGHHAGDPGSCGVE